MCKETEIDIKINELAEKLIDLVKETTNKYKKLSIMVLAIFIIENLIIFSALAYFLTHSEIDFYTETYREVEQKVEGNGTIVNQNGGVYNECKSNN